MGQIQNEINSTISAVAGAAVGAKHLSNQAKANELAGMQAVDQAKKDMQPLIEENAAATEAYNKAAGELKGLNKAQKELKGLENGTATLTEETQSLIDNNYPGLGSPDESLRQEAKADLNKDIKAMQTAKKELKGHQDAMVQQMTERMQQIQRIQNIAQLQGGKF